MKPQQRDHFQDQPEDQRTTGDLQQPKTVNLGSFHLPGFQNFWWLKLAISCAASWHPLPRHDTCSDFSESIIAACTGFSSKLRAPRWQCKHCAFLNPPGIRIAAASGGVLTYSM